MEKVHKLSPPAGRPTTASEALDYVIALALKYGASDIHLAVNFHSQNPQVSLDPFLFRIRIGGKLQLIKSNFLTGLYKEMVARMKVLAGMQTTEIGVPQDGQLAVEGPNGVIVLRISTVPNQVAEDVVIRVQRGLEQHMTVDQLQVTNEMRGQLKQIIQQKSGLILLNGPAGSGKTTTIYSIINTLASPERKILTAEDPVETRLPFVSHTQVTGKTTFATLSRAFMRQDADVIFIGEIRDEESAQTALQLAQTGHLVLSTLHTRDAIGAITRLEALGIHPNSISTTLIGSLSQRLVPALCQHCRTPAQIDAILLGHLASILHPGDNVKIYEAGPGCDKCISGYSGRLPIFELLIVDTDLSDAINRCESKSFILDMARKKGMRTLAEEALLRVYAGYTDLASVRSYLWGPEYQSVQTS